MSWTNDECPFCTGELSFNVIGDLNVIVRCAGCGLSSKLFTGDDPMTEAKLWASTRGGVDPSLSTPEVKTVIPNDFEDDLPMEAGCF